MANTTTTDPKPAPPPPGAAPGAHPAAMPVLVGGFLGLVATAALPLFGHPLSDGALPACSLLVVTFGLALQAPSLLQDGSKSDAGVANVSAMRVAVLLIVSVFALVTVKVGWSTATLADLKIDPSWAWVLAAALGGKAAQSFAEK